jgi:hypothetical protein
MFSIDRKLIKVRSVTNVPEFKGEKREHACSVKFEYQSDNTVLDILEPTRRTTVSRRSATTVSRKWLCRAKTST